jgi:hypothetical protein
MPLNFHYAVHAYLDNWVVYDRKARNVLGFGSGTPTLDEACNQLKKVATFYSVARNFKKVEVECERFSPLWTALQEIKHKPVSAQDAKDCVEGLVEVLEKTYFDRLWSAASKFLWMRFGSPIIIFDSLTWNWMCKHGDCPRDGSYAGFYDAWRTKFDEYQKEIVATCDELLNANVNKFLCPSMAEENEIELVVKSPWFAERVFDFAIMNAESRKP